MCEDSNFFKFRLSVFNTRIFLDLGVTDKHKILLCLTDAAPYMKKAMKGINILYTKMIHVTCFAHGLHRLAEFVREKNTITDQLISKVKKLWSRFASAVQNDL